MTARQLALLAATAVSLIYGLTFTIAKDVMPAYIQPFGFILIRVGVAAILFWISGFFGPKEKVDLNDFPRIVSAALFGVALNMLTFFKGLSLTSPISAAVIMVTTPIIVLLLSSFLIKEKPSFRKISGIVIGLTGTLILIYYGKKTSSATRPLIGNILVFINAFSYGCYLILVKKLMDKYHALSFVKWIYSFGFLMVLPFGWDEFIAIQWPSIPANLYWKIGFVVLFSTYFTYLLNLLSMRVLLPTTVAVFIYLQPLFAAIIAVSSGKDELNWVKIISAILIFSGVFMVTQKKNRPKSPPFGKAF